MKLGNIFIFLLPMSTMGLSRFDPDPERPISIKTSNINVFWLTNLTLEITMPDNSTDLILLKGEMNNIANLTTPCLFSGKLDEDPYSVVAVSGCLDSSKTTLSIASRLVPNGLVDLAIVNGTTNIIDTVINADDTDTDPDDMLIDHHRFKRQAEFQRSEDDYLIPPPDPNPIASNVVVSAILPAAVVVKTSIRYDSSLLQKFGGSHTATKQWISSVLQLTKPRLSLLNIGIQLNVVGTMEHHNEVIKADDPNINRLRVNTPQQSFVSYFCADICRGRCVIGIAYRGAACRTDGYAININEYYTETNSALNSARVFAHELGHNVGMWHDFDNIHGGHSGPCDGNGLMSYGSTPDAWSSCSNADFTSFYRGGGARCLEEANIQTDYPQSFTLQGNAAFWRMFVGGNHHSQCLGLYRRMNLIQNGRPVWKLETATHYHLGHVFLNQYLFYTGRYWVFGPDYTWDRGYIESVSSGLLSIPSTGWAYGRDGVWKENPSLRVTILVNTSC